MREQLQEVRERLAQLDPNNRDHLAEIGRLKTQEAELLKQIAVEEAEAELQAQHEERVKESVEHVVDTLDNLEIEGIPVRSLFIDEARYQLLSIWLKDLLAEQAEGFSKQIQAEQMENKQLRVELDEQLNIIGGLKDEITSRDHEIAQLKLERDQAIQYRDNAYAQLEEARQEVERLNDQVDDLRKEIAVGARNAFKVTNLTGTKELADKIKASLTPVLDIVHINSNTIRVTHMDGSITDENWLNKGKYRVVDDEEAARFRAEQEAKAVEESTAGDPALVEPPTFQIPNDAGGVSRVQPEADSGDYSTSREDVDAVGIESHEERIRALEIAVFGKAKGAA